MPLKNGELSTPEIRKLIRAHNVLVSIVIPPKSTRQQIIDILDKKGYTVNHKNKAIIRKDKKIDKINVNLTRADRVLKKPEKTQEQKDAMKASKEKKAAKLKQREGDLIKAGATLAKVRAKAKAKKPDPEPEVVPEEDEVLQLEDSNVSINKALRRKKNIAFKQEYKKSIYQVLGLGKQKDEEQSPRSPAEIKKICRKLKLKNHPDKGGSPEVFDSIQKACDIFMETFRD